MEQEEALQDERAAVVSAEAKDEEKEATNDKAKRNHYLYRAFATLFVAILFGFAPQYMQTNMDWIVYTSGLLFAVCSTASFYFFHHYINLLRHDGIGLLNLAMVFGGLMAIVCYLISEFRGKPFSDPEFGIEFRGMSFLGLLIVVFIVSMRLPEFMSFCRHDKDTLKALFT